MLRGVNVSGQKKIKMEELRKLYESLEFEQVQTYIQSGNVIFQTALTDKTEIIDKIQKQILNVFGFLVTIVIRTREERVNQVRNREETVNDFSSYIPIGNSIEKVLRWSKQGAKIIYLSFHRKYSNIQKDETILKKFNFPDGPVLYRKGGEEYKNIIERINPDILIEDNCESIGGVKEMIFTHLGSELRNRVKSVVVKEFNGIDDFPDSLQELCNS